MCPLLFSNLEFDLKDAGEVFIILTLSFYGLIFPYRKVMQDQYILKTDIKSQTVITANLCKITAQLSSTISPERNLISHWGCSKCKVTNGHLIPDSKTSTLSFNPLPHAIAGLCIHR